ncbi:MAG: hypothetical protein IJZ98_04805 [Bacteroidales bacterium]|nr:hypothetical protein [Bacteroidales bacterium]
MRRFIILVMTLAMAAFAFNNCAYPDWEPQAPSGETGDGGTVTPTDPDKAFSVVATIVETKTVSSETGTLAWEKGDQINVFHAVSGETTYISDNAATVDDVSKGLFKGTLSKGLKKGYTYDWYLFYPYTENLTVLDNAASVTIGSGAAAFQTQAGNDSKAHVSGDAMPLYGTAMGVEEGKTPTAEMQHLASILEVNVINGVTPVLTVSEVKIEVADAIVGAFTMDFVEGTLIAVQGAASNTATLKVTDGTGLEKGQSAKFYLLVKPGIITPADGLKISVNGVEKDIELTENIVLAPGQTASIDFNYYTLDFEETLVGAYKIKNLWVYGGTGPEYNSTAYLKMQEKTWCFDEEAGHGITAEMDNYLEFTLIDLIEGGNKTTGKCVNWAGKDGKNWSCWYNQTKVPWNKADLTHLYRQIPVGESTWVRDYTVEPNTVTFTDSEGKTTVLELLAPQTITPNDGSTRSLTLENEAFHVSFKNLGLKDNWTHAYDDLGRIYYKPRNYFVEVVKVDEVPAEARTSEPVFVPTLPPDPNVVPATIAGTYIHSYAYCNGGIDPAFVAFVDKPWAFNENGAGNVYKMKDDIYVFTATGTDSNGYETGEVDFQPGADGEYWDMIYPAAKHKKDGLGDLDMSSFYGKIPHGKSTYVYNKDKLTVTITQGDHTATANYLMPGEHTISGKAHTVTASFALDFDLNYTGPNVPGYAQDWSDFERFYVAPHNYVLHLQKQ